MPDRPTLTIADRKDFKHQPREAFEALCHFCGVESMNIDEISISAGLNELPRVTVRYVAKMTDQREN